MILTQFRRRATGVPHEYLVKGFAMNDELLKNMSGGSYWKELLERIRDIRASENWKLRAASDTTMPWEKLTANMTPTAHSLLMSCPM